jgi:hypothetical protein
MTLFPKVKTLWNMVVLSVPLYDAQRMHRRPEDVLV